MADDELDARFQKFINEPGSQNSRLRDAFAQLLAQGNGQAVPVEAVWGQQGPQQFPKPPAASGAPDIVRDEVEANNLVVPGDFTTIRRLPPNPDLDVRQAMPGLGSSDNPWRTVGKPDPPPFGGKGLVVGPGDEGYMLPKPYQLPKKPDKKNKKKDKG